jgi:proteasome beta subunit
VAGLDPARGRLAALARARTSSFAELLRLAAPELLPGRRPLLDPAAGSLAAGSLAAGAAGPVPAAAAWELAPHGTTIVALACAGGAVMAGDRRETMGNLVSGRHARKVTAADPFTLLGTAGVAGICVELARLYQVELEHYEKIEGAVLSLPAKANRLAAILRGNLAAAMQGLGALPLRAGFDPAAPDPQRAGRVFAFDLVGGWHEESGFDAIGSGSVFARSALKKRYRPEVGVQEAVRLAVEALYDAADDDTATGGPDRTRKIYPVVMTATAEGTRRLTEAEAAEVGEAVVAGRMDNPGG